MRCLKNIKWWFCIDNLKFSALNKDAEVHSDYEELKDEVKSYLSSDTQWQYMSSIA